MLDVLHNFTPFFVFCLSFISNFFLLYVTCFYISLFQTITLKKHDKKRVMQAWNLQCILYAFVILKMTLLLLVFSIFYTYKKKKLLGHFLTELLIILYFFFAFVCFFLYMSFKGCWQNKIVTQSKKKLVYPSFGSISLLDYCLML